MRPTATATVMATDSRWKATSGIRQGFGKANGYDTLGGLAGRYLATYGRQNYDNLRSHALAWNAKCASLLSQRRKSRRAYRSLWDKEASKRQATPQAETIQPANGQAVASAKPRLVTRQYSAIEAKPIDWLWPGKIPLGMVTILAGLGGWGKSTVS